MDEKSIAGLLSHLIPDSIENSLGLGNASVGEPDNRLVESRKPSPDKRADRSSQRSMSF